MSLATANFAVISNEVEDFINSKVPDYKDFKPFNSIKNEQQLVDIFARHGIPRNDKKAAIDILLGLNLFFGYHTGLVISALKQFGDDSMTRFNYD